MNAHQSLRKFIALCALLFIYTHMAYAYLDPGTGSMLLAVLIGVLSTLLYAMKSIWVKIIRRAHSYSKTHTHTQLHTIVFYSEGSHYWASFQSTIEALIEKKVYLSYLSSDEQDPGLLLQSPYVHTRYIGKGNKAYTVLNLLEAHICVLTTPNLDVLQIRKSKLVTHYTHILHAPTDIHLYKLFAFDFYDSIMISGPHQKKSLQHLEQIRHTKPKTLYEVGCPYYDVMMRKKNVLSPHTKKETTILVAPTWGESSLLHKNGATILQLLLQTHSSIIVRPHPQSYKVENALISKLTKQFEAYHAIEWDNNPDQFDSLARADLLISDRSGIIFDFAFVFERPVIIYDTEIIFDGMEGKDIPWDAWELEAFSHFCKTFDNATIDSLPSLLTSVLASSKQFSSYIAEMKEKYLYHFGNAGNSAAETLIALLSSSPQKHKSKV